MREEWRVSDGQIHAVTTYPKGSRRLTIGHRGEVLCTNVWSDLQRASYGADRCGLRFEYADFLARFPWDNYGTITYKRPRHDAIHAAARAFQVLERFNATRAFIAIEPNTLEGIHLHILSRHLPKLDSLKPLWSYCFKAFGRNSFETIDETLGVARYCAKYIVKGNQYEFKGDASAWTLDS